MTTPLHARIAENLTTLRKSTALSRTQLANQLIISRSTYIPYETGERLPDMETLHRLAEHYHITVDTLMNGTPSEVLAEHLLHNTYTDEQKSILKMFNSMTDFSKGRLIEHAKGLLNIDLDSREAKVRLGKR